MNDGNLLALADDGEIMHLCSRVLSFSWTRLLLILVLILPAACATPQSYVKKGNAFYEAEQYQLALPEYSKAMEAYQTDREFLLRLARTYWHMNRFPECQQTLMKMLALDEADLDALRQLAMLYSVGRRFDLLSDVLKKIIVHDPQDPISRNNLGIIYQKAKKLRDAEEHFLQAIKVDKDYPDAWLNLGNLYAQDMKDDATAYYFYRRFLELVPNSPRVVDVRTWIRDYDLSHVGENARARAQEHFFKGEEHLREARFEQSLLEYREALRLSSDHRFMFKCAYVEKELGQYDDARKHLLDALAQDSNNTEYMTTLGWVYKLMGDNERAREQWENVLRYTPDDERVRKALNLIEPH